MISLVVLVLASLALAGCGSLPAAGALLPGPTATTADRPTGAPSPMVTNTRSGTPSPSGSTRTVTLADDGHTITMHVGERFLLSLGDGYDWRVTPADPTVISRVVNVLTIRGSQGLYEAHKPGQTELTATGDPTCRQARPPCAAPSRVFRVQVVVVP